MLSFRFFHFTEEIDGPHDWRQCDTAHYINDFYKNGIDIFHPTVCWMGNRDTVILECPLPEALVAGIYKMSGPSILVARLVFIFIFCISVFYFYKIIISLFTIEIAELATLCYLALPLSLYYSRAIHIDFSVVALTHAMVYYFIRGIQKHNGLNVVLSSLLFLFAVLIKAPYVFYWALPLGFVLFSEKAIKWFMPYSILFILSLIFFYLWQQHTHEINSQSPDLFYILGYRHMTMSAGWYFGTLSQRVDLYSYWVLLKRGIFEVAGIGGISFLFIGLYQMRRQPFFTIQLLWMLGIVIFVFTFFNLNLVHNYYQIPLLAPVAILCALGINKIHARYSIQKWYLVSILIGLNVFYSFITYYKIPEDEIEIARILEKHTGEKDLLIVTYNSMDCRNPKILYRAHRKGWSINEMALNATVIERLYTEQQARYWAYVGTSLPEKKMINFLSYQSLKYTIPLQQQKQNLYIFELK
ncbi:MAG: glycosyltransferase family 39 protein [Saprospiraceae bacterium]|nr:glycosyltransferase family 39 protein [Saprospiraceae bacterium]